jgi:hypothetical protein
MAVGVNARTALSLLFPPILDEFGWDRDVAADGPEVARARELLESSAVIGKLLLKTVTGASRINTRSRLTLSWAELA